MADEQHRRQRPRIVVATLVNGVFRGPKTGCVAPSTTGGGEAVRALAVVEETVWYAKGVSIMKVAGTQ